MRFDRREFRLPDDVKPPAWLTADWLTAALAREGAPAGRRVRDVRAEWIGDFSNRLWRLHVTFDGNGGEAFPPTSIVLKHPRPGRADDPSNGLDEEIRFYRELGSRVPVATPALCFAEPERLLLGLEEIRDLEPIDFLAGATERHLQLAADQLAALHAAFAGRVADLAWIPSFADGGYCDALAAEYDRDWPERRSTIAEIEPGFVPIGDRLVGAVSARLARSGEGETLLHGDAHFENLALRRAGDGTQSLLFHDWGLVRRGSPSFDVAVLVVMSLPVERRRALERDIVAWHDAALRERGVRQGDAWLGYRYGVFAWAVRMNQFARNALESPGLRLVTHRTAVAAIDHRIDELVGPDAAPVADAE